VHDFEASAVLIAWILSDSWQRAVGVIVMTYMLQHDDLQKRVGKIDLFQDIVKSALQVR
jgi:hypothetical protein